MVTPTEGAIVPVPFPFSDLSQTKLRPALVLADAGRGDWIFCQITSKPYGDTLAVPNTADDLEKGLLRVLSDIRPEKLFTVKSELAVACVAQLKVPVFERVLEVIADIFRPRSS